ncbi:MAG TPA: SDR family NAD(P)-dependent oxidoreductase [Castellaniella sp.]|uniref:SDR family NAD(P)-dependent oxidoreductase n=1 Tax=Castellaniella sp. TaxID=1955812 RepID=UPI002F0B06A0
MALVTGAAGGIGRAVAAEFAHAGLRQALWDRNQEALAQLAGQFRPSALPVVADLANEQSVAGAMSETWSHFRQLDVLVHCVGVTGPCVPLAQYELKDWEQTLAINLTSTFLCARAAIPYLKQSPAGRIVLMASIAGKEGNSDQSAYSAAKAGVIALTKSLGKELAGTSVRVNCVAPAVIKTELIEQMTPEALQRSLAKIPMGRPGEPDEVARMIAWLASDACSFSTGSTFDLSGGRATY